MFGDNTSIFDKVNRPFLVIALIEWIFVIGIGIYAYLGK